MNISLTDELMQLVQQKIASGMYNNASEVVREALRNFDDNEQLTRILKVQFLKQALQPGLADAAAGRVEPWDVEAFIAGLDEA